MNEIVGVLPEIGSGIGYTGGRMAARWANIMSADKTLAAIDTYGPVEGMPEPPVLPLSTKQRLAHWGAPVAIAGAIAGGLFVPAFFNHESSPKVENPVLQTVYDDAGQIYSGGGFARARTILTAFENDKKIQVDMLVARGGGWVGGGDSLTIADVLHNADYDPLGGTYDASLPTATQAALGAASGESTPAVSNVIGDSSEATGAVLIISDNDSVGEANQIIAEAKGKEHIYIANIGTGSGPNTTALQNIAQQTGGIYWNATQKTNQVAKEMVQEINPIGVPAPKVESGEWQTWLKVLDLGAFGLTAAIALGMANVKYKRLKEAKE